MGYLNREIETKLVFSGAPDLHKVNASLSIFYGNSMHSDYTAGTSRDTYWNIPGKLNAFARIRERDGICQMTIKEEDKGSSLNRIEIDIDSISKIKQLIEYNTYLYGPSIGMIDKFHHTYFLDDSRHESVCCYQVKVNGEQKKEIYLEVESRTEETMTYRVNDLQAVFSGLELATGSLWRMYLK